MLSYGRGCPRPVFIGYSPKAMISNLPKQSILDYYRRFSTKLDEVGFAQNEEQFLLKMKQIKKQGYYFSNGELDPNIAGLSIPIKFSAKEPPLALTLLASKNRFEFVNLQKLIDILKENAALIEKKFEALAQNPDG